MGGRGGGVLHEESPRYCIDCPHGTLERVLWVRSKIKLQCMPQGVAQHMQRLCFKIGARSWDHPFNAVQVVPVGGVGGGAEGDSRKGIQSQLSAQLSGIPGASSVMSMSQTTVASGINPSSYACSPEQEVLGLLRFSPLLNTRT